MPLILFLIIVNFRTLLFNCIFFFINFNKYYYIITKKYFIKMSKQNIPIITKRIYSDDLIKSPSENNLLNINTAETPILKRSKRNEIIKSNFLTPNARPRNIIKISSEINDHGLSPISEIAFNLSDTSIGTPQKSGLDIINGNGTELSRQLDSWLSVADLIHGPARAIIAPHAGYAYCGACAGFAYRQVSPAVVKRIFILGPSHHVRLRGCALSVATKYKTPLYDLKIDTQINAQLEETEQFSFMDMKTDEDEHSIEMHLPYIAKVMEDYKDQFTIVPVLVGSLSPEQEAVYGEIFGKYFTDPQNLFVISSDFCHWGQRFRYTYYEKSLGPIYKSIERLDKQGMDIIETLEPVSFTDYLRKFSNTICGRHPIGIMLNASKYLKSMGYNASFKFLKYAQSSQCHSMQDSSVSYASGSLVFES